MAETQARKQRERPAGEEEGLWVSSALDLAGEYFIELHLGADRAWALPADRACAYALAVARVAITARHDAALFALLCKMLPELEAAKLIAMLRAERAPYDDEVTAPLRWRPGLTQHGKPFIIITLEGEQAQTDPDGAIGHAEDVLEVAAVVDLDRDAVRWLTEQVGVEKPIARAAVSGLLRYSGTEAQ